VASAAVVAVLVGSCSQGLGDASLRTWPEGPGPVPEAQQAPVRARSGTPSDDPAAGSLAETVSACRALARGPWRELRYPEDAVALVRAGRLPVPGQGDTLGTPEQVHEFATVEDYRDHSTYEDPGAVFAAMDRAGFEAGAEGVWGSGLHLSAITAARFRDPAAARDVLTAQLDDYCRRARSAVTLEDDNGLTVYRRSGASRTLFVVGDTVVSVFTCGCSGVDSGLWSSALRRQLEGSGARSTS
jgi:hypothetical protein